mgnify:CR=1 FL=1
MRILAATLFTLALTFGFSHSALANTTPKAEPTEKTCDDKCKEAKDKNACQKKCEEDKKKDKPEAQ